jgi:hypothetical protein
MKNLALFIFSIFTFSLTAQNFEKLINLTDKVDFTYCLAVTKGNSLLLCATPFSITSNFQNAVDSSFLVKLDKNGNTLIQKSITPQDLDPQFGPTVTILNISSGTFLNNEWYLTGVIGPVDADDNRNNAFIRLDTNLNIVATSLDTSFINPNNTNHYQAWIRTESINDSTIAVLGAQQYKTTGNVLIVEPRYVEYDTRNMKAKRRRSYQYINNPYEPIMFRNILTKNGFRYLFTTGTDPIQGVSRIQAYKLGENDSIHEFELIDPPYINNRGGAYTYEAQAINWLTDTSFIYITSEKHRYRVPPSSNYKESGDVKMLVYDTSLNIINHKTLTISDTVNLVSDFGNSLKYDSKTDTYYYGFTCNLKEYNHRDYDRLYRGDTAFFRLIRFDRDLNIIWDRSYRRDGRMEMHSLEVDHDGNIIMAGVYNPRANNNLYDFDLFVLKVDSTGNLNTVGLNDSKKIDPINYSIYPNPASNQFTIKQYNVLEDYELKLMNINGQLIKSTQLKSQTEQQINIEGLTKGIYLYQLISSNGKIATGKLIKN